MTEEANNEHIDIVNIELKDNSQRAQVLIYVFGALTIFILIGIWASYNELQLLKRVEMGEYISEQEAVISEMILGLIGLLQVGLYIASIVFFLNWFRRAYGNLHRMGTVHLQYKESMALWAWFIPIIFLFRPYEIMTEIWTKTQDNIKKFDPLYIAEKGGLIIGLWWILFLVSHFVGRYVLKGLFAQDTIEQIIEFSKASILSDFIQVPEAFLVMYIVYKISKMESIMAEEVTNAGGRVVYS